jgi:lactate racemase
MGIVRRRAEIHCYSDGLDAETLRRCHVQPVGDVERAVADALDAHGPGSRLYVIPEGPYVTPVVVGKDGTAVQR